MAPDRHVHAGLRGPVLSAGLHRADGPHRGVAARRRGSHDGAAQRAADRRHRPYPAAAVHSCRAALDRPPATLGRAAGAALHHRHDQPWPGEPAGHLVVPAVVRAGGRGPTLARRKPHRPGRHREGLPADLHALLAAQGPDQRVGRGLADRGPACGRAERPRLRLRPGGGSSSPMGGQCSGREVRRQCHSNATGTDPLTRQPGLHPHREPSRAAQQPKPGRDASAADHRRY